MKKERSKGHSYYRIPYLTWSFLSKMNTKLLFNIFPFKFPLFFFNFNINDIRL